MKLSEANAGLFTAEIDISEFFHAKPGDFKVKLREVNETEMNAIQAAEKGVKQTEQVSRIWKDCVLESTLLNDDETGPADLAKVKNLIQKSSAAVAFLVREFMNQLPLVKLSAKNAETSQELSSTAE